MTYDLSSAPTAPKTRGTAAIITGAVLLVLGLIGLVVGIVGITSTATGLLGQIGTPQTTPATITQQLDAGTSYAVYEGVPGGAASSDDVLDLQVVAADVLVTAPDGSNVAVSDTGDSVNTVGNGDELYAEVATFDPPTSGSYRITVATTGALVAVAPATSSIGRAARWAAVIGVGIILGFLGLVVLIIGVVVRSGSRRAQRAALTASSAPVATAWPQATGEAAAGDWSATAAAAPQDAPADAPAAWAVPTPDPVAPAAPAVPALPAAGWYPDPERPGGQRWWDGAAWTEHRA